MAEIQAVCFDIGGVLAHVALSWDSAMIAAGFQAGPSFQVPLEILPAFRLYQAGELDIEAYLDEVAEFLSIDSTAALKVHESILLKPTTGTLEIVDQLNGAGLKTGCLSNTNTLHWGVLNDPVKFPNVCALRFKAASHDIGYNKPDEASYRAFESIADVHGQHILFFEDTEANIAGAISAGWNAVQIDPTRDQANQIQQALAHHGLC